MKNANANANANGNLNLDATPLSILVPRGTIPREIE